MTDGLQELFENPPNIRETTAATAKVVTQDFERGEMIWFAPEQSDENGFIFVLMDDIGQWFRTEDVWDGVTAPDVEPPPGLITPGGGFGNIWFQQPKDHPDLLAILGFALFGESETTGHYHAQGDGWELHVTGVMISLSAGKMWRPDDAEPEPEPEPEPGPEPGPGLIFEPSSDHWVWLSELKMPVNLAHAAWIGADHLRIGAYDIVLSLPPQTALTLRAYVKTLCVKII